MALLERLWDRLTSIIHDEFGLVVLALLVVFGAVGGAVIRALFNEYVKGIYGSFKDRRALERRRREAAALLGHIGRKGLSFAGWTADVDILTFEPEGFRGNWLKSSWEALPADDLPPRYAAAYREARAFWQAKLEKGEIYEGATGIALKGISIDRLPGSEAKALIAGFRASASYVHQRAATQVFQELPTHERAELLKDPPSSTLPCFSNNCGVVAAVVTGDGKLVFSRRSKTTAVNKGRMICGVVEGMTVDDLESGKPSPHRAILRGLREELGISLEPREQGAIRVTGCFLNPDWHEWNFLGFVDLRPFGDSYRSDVLSEYFSTHKAHDKWEGRAPIFVDFDARMVARYLIRHDAELVNYAKLSAWAALMSGLADRRSLYKEFADEVSLFRKHSPRT